MSRSGSRQRAARVLARHSRLSSDFFSWVFERTLKRDFHAARIALAGPPPSRATPRLVIYSNHPSWWDGVVYVMIARHLLAGRRAFTPIDEAMLGRYRFMERIGAFGIAQNSLRGAADFLAMATSILEDARNVLIIAAQGRFADVRERPLRLRPGIAHLTDRTPDIVFVPLAIEYVYWHERQPELLMRFGAPIPSARLTALPRDDRLACLEDGLRSEMDALASDAIAKNEAAFSVLISGKVGVNAFYDGWQRIRSVLSGSRFAPGHRITKP